MAAPIALQLYTVRDALAKNFEKVISQIADMGYIGVESAGFPGITATDAGDLFAEYGLEVCSAHTPLPVGGQIGQTINIVRDLGIDRIVSGTSPDNFQSVDSVKQLCDKWNKACREAKDNNLELGLHNHWWEFQEVEGQPSVDLLLEHLDPEIFFQVDTYWVQAGGANVIEVLEKLEDRTPLLHIKDGPATPEGDMVAVGQGVMDFPAIIEASMGTTEWLIVELDRCGTDMLEAVAQSYDYLVGAGLARGAK